MTISFYSLSARCRTCPFIRNVEKISGPKRSINITDHFTCTSASVIYCITYTLCKKLYIGQTKRRLGDRFREHLWDAEKEDENASKPVARNFNLPNHSKQDMAVCDLSHIKKAEKAAKLQNRSLFFKPALLILTVSTNLFCCFSRYHAQTTHIPQFLASMKG